MVPSTVVVLTSVLFHPAPSAGQSPSVGIHRNTSAVTSVGTFQDRVDAGAPPPVDDPPPGSSVRVGSTGALAGEHGPNVALRGTPVAPPPGVDMTTPIGPSDVAMIVHAQEAGLRACYTRALATHPGLTGRVAVRFVIARNGQLTQPLASGLPEAPEVATCIAQALPQLRFPPPATGTLPFSYNLSFSPPVAVHGHGHGHVTRLLPAAHH